MCADDNNSPSFLAVLHMLTVKSAAAMWKTVLVLSLHKHKAVSLLFLSPYDFQWHSQDFRKGEAKKFTRFR